MMTPERSNLVTRTGPGTPAGAVLRRHWLPAALSDEVAGERPLAPVRLLGEDLVLFRDEAGHLGLIERHCPHRGVDLTYGRLEDGGLRCPFHGWLMATDGRCLEQPAEPVGSRAHEKIRTTCYPVEERNGIVFAYLGPGTPPPLPALDCLHAPASHIFAFKGLWHCNWLQALEIGIDPAHASFQHRFFEDEDGEADYGRQFRDSANDIPITRLLREHHRPEILLDETGWGLRIKTLRHLDDARTHVRVTNLLFPCAIHIPMSREITITQWHVPVDDTRCYWVSMFTSFTEPVDAETMRAQRLAEHSLPDYAPLKGAANAYGYDPAEQKTLTFTGMGMDINVHDQWAVESMGAIQNREKEHLATTDKAIAANRRLLLQAIGERDAAVRAGDGEMPIALDTIGPTAAWDEIWREADAARRAACPWPAETADG